MSKSVKKVIETDLTLPDESYERFTLRLNASAHQALNKRKKNEGSSFRFIINDIIKRLPVMDYSNYFEYINENKKDKEHKRIIHVSNTLIKTMNKERLNNEMFNMENYAIIHKHKITKQPALLNYIIVTYINK